MVGSSFRICKGRIGKRGGHLGFIHYLSIIVFCGSLLALLFIDVIELWVTSLGMSKVEGFHGLVLPHSIPPTRSEEYLLMPSVHVCERAKPFLIALVVSAPPNRKARQAIRDSWGGEIHVRGHRVLTLFVVGQPSDPVLGKELVEESKERGDLIQGRFIDSYANLTLKTLSMLGWARRFCPQAHYLAKVDDDVLFNPSALLQYLNHSFKSAESELAELYLGRVHMQVAPDRNPSSRHFMSETAYAGVVFPDYCSGTAYVLSRPALLKLSLAAVAIPLPSPLPPEDVFVGICAHTAGITPTHSPLFSGGPAVPFSRCCYQTMVSVHHTKPGDMVQYWTQVHSTAPCSWLGARTSLGVCKVRALLGTLLGRDS
ncbi:putative UDP-GlcNAc:betaGal beta-1,3-N-acetylglucosaminyltransferase LOC100288842 [Pimephales promelas]|uniref:putative UDP-GlcNAc:betaGal beta-1,3-N-acetylglucosaminyltransferase LOC100288842 n=1 Tax=Pimephales promelas TaxID=90988 RepID=UPI001955EED6|nr:putative UDP-GlcNAc:betaGal beta-1,3-N-acetylglucosaminyltransferase LOC100288842 [Pimephales promelas]